jgi:hypothetical protein
MWFPAQSNITVMPWPSKSLDLNLIGHLCDDLIETPLNANHHLNDWASSDKRCNMNDKGYQRFPCCMESAIVLLKYLPLSEILYIHGIPVAVTVAVTVRLRRWTTPIYRSWVGVAMRGLPLLERSWSDPVWFNLCQRRENVVVWTINTWLWIIYIGGLGGGGIGGTGCQTATGFSVSIFPISRSVASRLSVGKTKLYIIFTINILC